MIKQAIRNLEEIKDLLGKLSEEEYNYRSALLSDASVGQHVRHVLEFYTCLFDGMASGKVDYDCRKRDIVLETDIDAATRAIGHIVVRLSDLKEDVSLVLAVNYSTTNDSHEECINSSLFREIANNIEHTIHHQALIKVAVRDMGQDDVLDESFGFAPSTIRHKNSLCAQ